MDVDCAKAALRTLVYYDFIALVDIFKFSNIYVTSTTEAAAFRDFAQSPALFRECQGFVCNHAAAAAATTTASAGAVATVEERKERGEAGGGGGGGASKALPSLPSGEDLIRLYSACRPGVTLAEVLQTHKEKMGMIDPRRFVTFGVVYGFLRRVHRYPVYIRLRNKGGGGSSSSSSSGGGLIMVPPSRSSSLSRTQGGQQQHLQQQQQQQQQQHLQQQQQQQQHQHQQLQARPGIYPPLLVEQVQAMLDGARTMDEVCVAFMRSFEDLEDIALSAGGGEILILYK